MFREAFNGGYFSYNMATNSKTGLSLMVRYWGGYWNGAIENLIFILMVISW